MTGPQIRSPEEVFAWMSRILKLVFHTIPMGSISSVSMVFGCLLGYFLRKGTLDLIQVGGINQPDFSQYATVKMGENLPKVFLKGGNETSLRNHHLVIQSDLLGIG